MSKKRINLALQGGGAHGAFTWGVLDRLLDDEDIEIEGVSGTSAGAMNAAALKSGLIEGGREGARENLNWLWDQVAATPDFPFADWMELLSPNAVAKSIEYSIPFMVADTISRVVSPYAYGPFYKNPLERIVSRFHYDTVCADTGPQLFISATNVRTGKIRVFSGTEISTDVIMASACLPTLFQAVEVKDPVTGCIESYWDGGYTGNPALFPLFDMNLPNDIVVVNINPLSREDVPMTAPDILNRINEISFNSSLLRELRAIQFAKRLLEDGHLEKGAMKDVFVHMIADDLLMTQLSVATKLVPTAYIIEQLKESGRKAAGKFLKRHKGDLNVRASLDLPAMYG